MWTICWDRSWVFCLGIPPNPGDWRGQSHGMLLPFPIIFAGGGAWWYLNACVSPPPAPGAGECTLFWGMSGRRPEPPLSLPLLHGPAVLPPRSGVTGTYMQTGNLSPTHTRCPPWLRGRVTVAWWQWWVLWGGQCQPPPEDPARTVRMRPVLPRASPGSAGVCPQVFPPSQARGGTGH